MTQKDLAVCELSGGMLQNESLRLIFKIILTLTFYEFPKAIDVIFDLEELFKELFEGPPIYVPKLPYQNRVQHS